MAQQVDRPCPACGRMLRVRSEFIGHRVVCKGCNHVFRVEADSPSAPRPAAAPVGAEPDGLRARVAALERELQRARNELTAVTARHDSATYRLQQVQAEYSNVQGQLRDLQAKVAGTDQEARQAPALRQQLESSKSEIAQLRTQLTALQEASSRVSALETELQTSRADAGQFRSALEAAQVEAQTRAEETARQLADSQAEAEQLRQEVQDLQTQLVSLTSDRDEQLLHLAQDLEGTRAEAATAAELRSRVASLEHLLAEASALLEETRSAMPRAVEEARQNWETERATLEDEWEEALREHARAASEQQAHAEAERERLIAERDAKLQEFEQDNATLRGEVERLTGELTASASRTDELVEDRDRLAAQLSELTEASRTGEERLRSERRGIGEELEQLQQRYQAAMRATEGTAADAASLRDALDNQRAKEAEQERQIAALRQELQSAIAEAELARSQSAAGDGWENRLAEVTRQKERLEDQIARHQEEIAMLRKTLWELGIIVEGPR